MANINWERNRKPSDDQAWRRLMVDEQRDARPGKRRRIDVPKTPLRPRTNEQRSQCDGQNKH